ncbi:glycerophosphodiester phosphodiesterase [Halorubrum sp. CSM-61]|uniref:glycerophosphodiester phosphodiesterase n=1 Tax=Halorubrum sp. CSM-61 TaxID=2485838 RepID=UPI000F4D1021|nr:glycerophosphodiester phosphodiesterase [Halorubrum sp. CSM-61]
MTRPTDGEPLLFAHRGFAGENPENTVGAIESASAVEATDRIEIDAMPTADGDPVVFHDAALSGRGGPPGAPDDRGLTDATGVVRETDTATVTDAEVLDSGETVPLLGEALDAIPPGIGANVELKNPGRAPSALRPDEALDPDALAERKAVWLPFVERVLEVAEGRANDLLISSFHEAALAATREASAVPVAPLCSESVEDALEIARRYDATAVHPPIDAVRGTPFFDASRFGDVDVVAAARDAGRAVNAWTVETWHQTDRLAAAGVDGVIADYSTVGTR